MAAAGGSGRGGAVRAAVWRAPALRGCAGRRAGLPGGAHATDEVQARELGEGLAGVPRGLPGGLQLQSLLRAVQTLAPEPRPGAEAGSQGGREVVHQMRCSPLCAVGILSPLASKSVSSSATLLDSALRERSQRPQECHQPFVAPPRLGRGRPGLVTGRECLGLRCEVGLSVDGDRFQLRVAKPCADGVETHTSAQQMCYSAVQRTFCSLEAPLRPSRTTAGRCDSRLGSTPGAVGRVRDSTSHDQSRPRLASRGPTVEAHRCRRPCFAVSIPVPERRGGRSYHPRSRRLAKMEETRPHRGLSAASGGSEEANLDPISALYELRRPSTAGPSLTHVPEMARIIPCVAID